jgi:hypothetical protein
MIEGMRSHAGKAVFFVRGAGVQVDPRYADRLIRMLQRLHNEEEVESLDTAFATAFANVRHIGHRLGQCLGGRSGWHRTLFSLLDAQPSK